MNQRFLRAQCLERSNQMSFPATDEEHSTESGGLSDKNVTEDQDHALSADNRIDDPKHEGVVVQNRSKILDGESKIQNIFNFEGDIFYHFNGTAFVVEKHVRPPMMVADSTKVDNLSKSGGEADSDTAAEISNPPTKTPASSTSDPQETMLHFLQKQQSSDPKSTPSRVINFLTFFNASANQCTQENTADCEASHDRSIQQSTKDQEETVDMAERAVSFTQALHHGPNPREASLGELATSPPCVRNFRVHTWSDGDARVESTRNTNNNSNKALTAAVDEDKHTLLKRLLRTAEQSVEHRPNSEASAHLRRPILMCFPCRLTFGDNMSFLRHASSDHAIEPNEQERQILACSNVCSVIQEIAGGKCLICILEPVDDACAEISTEPPTQNESDVPRHLAHEPKTPSNVTSADSATQNSTQTYPSAPNASAEHGSASQERRNSNSANDVTMDTQDESASATTNDTSPLEDIIKVLKNIEGQADFTLGNLKGGDPRIGESLDPGEVTSQVPTPSERNNVQTDEKSCDAPALDESSLKTSRTTCFMPANADIGTTTLPGGKVNEIKATNTSMATTSETPMQFNQNLQSSKAAAKLNDTFAAGGVTNVDPLFHMSLFQSRNSCKTLKCPRCNWHYKYRQTLDAHMKEKHAEDISDCVFCNANQPHPRLSRGESYACGYKPFKCEVCNYSTTTKGNLSIHMQSDKHLYNVKTMQHQQEKLGGQAAGVTAASSNASALPARLLAEKQEQLQNFMQKQQMQARKHLSPDSASVNNTQKGAREHSASPTSNSNGRRHAPWRCDVCNYETEYSRNLRIHMQSEKHAHNVTLANAANAVRGGASLPRPQANNGDSGAEGDCSDAEDPSENADAENVASNKPGTSAFSADPNGSPSAMAALYYYLAALQSNMQGRPGDLPASKSDFEKEREKQQQQQLLLQQQQLLLAQQYQQMFAQLAGAGDFASPAGSKMSAGVLQQQLMFQQQLQLWRQLLAQNESLQSPEMQGLKGEADMNSSDQISSSTSNKFLFTCGVCCNFSCNDLESLCTHVRTPRQQRASLDDSEWVTRSHADGYLCRICNYATQLKTNFSLHCKTEKHTSKLQLINHIREGGAANEWKISYAIAGNNMNKVTCNGCRHSSNSIDKLRIHCSTDRHQGTLTMCHYLDSMLKDAEVSKGLRSSESLPTHHLSCRPCSYQSKFVVEMVQHMQCQKHQINVHQEQQRGGIKLAEMISAEPDQEVKDEPDREEKSEAEKALVDKGVREEERSAEDKVAKEEEDAMESQAFRCPYCNYSATEETRLQLHVMTQHSAQPAIKCPICQEFLNDTVHFQLHLIQVHNLANPDAKEPAKAAPANSEDESRRVEDRGREETKMEDEHPADSLSPKGAEEIATPATKETDVETFEVHCQQCGETVTSKEKWQLHMEIHRIQASAAASASSETHAQRTCTACQSTFTSQEQLRQHLKTKHHIHSIQFGNDSSKVQLPAEMMETDDQDALNNDSETDVPASIFLNPRLLLTIACRDWSVAQKVCQDSRFESAWEKLGPPYTCGPCEETFVSKSDLFDHIMTSSTHKNSTSDERESIKQTDTRGECGESAVNKTDDPPVMEQKCEPQDGAGESIVGDESGNGDGVVKPRDQEEGGEEQGDSGESGPGKARDSSNFDFSELSDPSWKRRGRLLYPGISKTAHKKVLVDLGLNQVIHFVENRSPENRERAKLWKNRNAAQLAARRPKTAQDDQEGVIFPSAENERMDPSGAEGESRDTGPNAGPAEDNLTSIGNKDTPREDVTEENNSLLPVHRCAQCGKEFSNIWVLKIHEKSIHNVDMSLELLEEFVEGYSKWYWKTAKKEAEESKVKNETNTKTNALYSHTANLETKQDNKAFPDRNANHDAPSLPSDSKGFQEAALQAIMKNYPNLLASTGGLMTQQSPQQQSSLDEAARLQQQQMFLQMLMTAQAQAALQQQAPGSQAQSTQNNSNNIMNVLMEQIYSSAAHGAAPPFLDPFSTLALLQQAQMPTSALNPYQWLALRAAQQQQQRQMQQLLMYPGMAGAGMPFMGNFSDNASQQQMLASLAANLLSSGMPSESLQTASVNSPIVAALQAYQLQAAAAAAASQSQPVAGRADAEDQSKTSVANYDSGSNMRPSPNDLPAKRPRTRITDEQLKILRANFDINTSPSENQISEMAVKTKLPSKVIKHWFRNTLFKERQRSKDSPYNFNIPPMTSLDDAKYVSASMHTSDHEEESRDAENGGKAVKMEIDQKYEVKGQNAVEASKSIYGQENVDSDLDNHGLYQASEKPALSSQDNSAMQQILKSLTERGASAEMQQSFFKNAFSLMPSLSEATTKPSKLDGALASSGYATESDRSATTSSDKDETQAYNRLPAASSYDRLPASGHSEYQYAPISTPSSMPAISRRTPRTRFSDYQLKVLQEFFDRNAYPKDEDLDRLSRMLDLSTRVIVVWFQNARQKARKSYELQQANSNPQHGGNSAAIAGSGFPHKRLNSPSPPSRVSAISPIATKRIAGMDMQKSIHTDPMGAKQTGREYAVNDDTSRSYASHFAKEEPASTARGDANKFQCHHCDATLPTSEMLQQHEKLHAIKTSPYMASVIQQYGMFYPPNFIESMIQNSSSSQQDSPHSGDAKRSQDPADTSSFRKTAQFATHPAEDKDSARAIKSEPGGGAVESTGGLSVSLYGKDGGRPRDATFDANMVRLSTSSSVQSALVPAQYGQNSTARDMSSYSNKRKMSLSPTFSISSSSSTSPNGARTNMNRKVISENAKDPKRLRTTITPEQLEFLYQQYLIDSSPSRKVIEQISDIVGLKKRVVQVWFQNTRARERKGQFRSVGRITSVLGMPQVCPHCRVTYRTKADLDAHVRYRHMQSPSSLAAVSVAPHSQSASPAMTSSSSRPGQTSPDSSRGGNQFTTGSGDLESARPVTALSGALDYQDIMNTLKHMKSGHIGPTTAVSTSLLPTATGSQSVIVTSRSKSPQIQQRPLSASEDGAMGPSSPKRRKLFGTSDASPPRHHESPFVTSSQMTDGLTAKAALVQSELASKAPSIDVIAKRLSSDKALSPEQRSVDSLSTKPALDMSAAYGTRPALPVPNSLPFALNGPFSTSSEPMGGPSPSSSTTSDPAGPTSGSPTYLGVPLKRYRTQMTSLQVRTLKHCFAEYKTPTLAECESLGAQIGLPKRVIQVWFQNARAKEKKAKQSTGHADSHNHSESVLPKKTSCNLCPGVHVVSLQDHRNHIFSKSHLQRFSNSCDGDGSEPDQSSPHSPSSDEYSMQHANASQESDIPHPYIPTNLSYSTENRPPSGSRHETNSVTSSAAAQHSQSDFSEWDGNSRSTVLATPALLQKYQQIAAVQKIMGGSSVQNGVDQKSASLQDSESANEILQRMQILKSFKQNWPQQTFFSPPPSTETGYSNALEEMTKQHPGADVNNNE